MKDSFRKSMAWLHTWCGLFCGWVLCAIFLTGTLSVFREPITRWMQAQPLLPVAANSNPVVRASAYLAATAPQAPAWQVDLPRRPGDAMQLAWKADDGSRHHVIMDPATGALLDQPWGRATQGGRHFMAFHYMLQGGLPGYWLVGFLSMGMLVALVSGVVVHKRIFKDFFTFRPGKGQRSWLDAHNAMAVLSLPFLFMIVYTGLSVFYISYMPWPMETMYGGKDAYEQYQAELALKPPPLAPPARSGIAAALPDLAALQLRADTLMGRPALEMTVDLPGDTHQRVRFDARSTEGDDSRDLLNHARSITFDGATGAILQLEGAQHDAGYAGKFSHEAMEQLHLAHFGGWSVKWLYFVGGLMGTAMMATGTILFCVKRRKKSEMEFGAATATVYRVIEACNVAALAGTALACIVYFYANRLLPAALEGRAKLEIQAFMYTWLASLLHALVRTFLTNPRQAWLDQLWSTALLCLALPLLNWVTTGQHLGLYLANGDGQSAAVELTAMAFGLAFACMARHVGKATQAAPVKQANRPVPAR
ncbi:PepSY-associated TM helix domain-containing protein [Janthinobacterium sp. Mn2066]|uniref:PepSY-associated TM helix domain-containing protein n=1 Tax=Janthinobacterium sp. Mn2066 TaxID=3395264 RepID=UPI003BD7C6C3